MRLKKYLASLIMVLCMGCGQDVRKMAITEDNMQEVVIAVRQSKRLTDEEKELVAEAIAVGLMAQGITKAFGAKKGVNPVLGKTVGQIINEGKKERKAQTAQEKRAPAKKLTGTELLDQKYGFRDTTFGMPLSSQQFQGATVFEESHGMKFVRRPEDKLKIGEADLKSITYIFYKDRLMRVNVTVAGGAENTAKAFGILESAYGVPTRSKTESFKTADFYQHYWMGRKVHLSYTRRVGLSAEGSAKTSASFSLKAPHMTKQMKQDQLPKGKEDL